MAFGGMLRENLFTRERGDFLQQLVVGGTYFSWLLFFSEGLLRWKEGVGEEDAGGEGDEDHDCGAAAFSGEDTFAGDPLVEHGEDFTKKKGVRKKGVSNCLSEKRSGE